MQGAEELINYQKIHKSIGTKIEKCNDDFSQYDNYADPIRVSIALREKARLSREIAQDLRRYSRMLKRI